jgi:hypothetical protein
VRRSRKTINYSILIDYRSQYPIFKISGYPKSDSEDENILILESPTLFSGNRTLYIMKKNKQFYLLEAGYSKILNNNEATLKQGSFLEFNK